MILLRWRKEALQNQYAIQVWIQTTARQLLMAFLKFPWFLILFSLDSSSSTTMSTDTAYSKEHAVDSSLTINAQPFQSKSYELEEYNKQRKTLPPKANVETKSSMVYLYITYNSWKGENLIQ